MSKTLFAALSLCLASALAAQRTGTTLPANTVTDYAVFATDGTQTGFQSVAGNTSIGSGLAIHAVVGGGPRTRPDALAHTSVVPVTSTMGAGLRVVETGRVHGTAAATNYAAGTSSDPPASPSPTQGAHTVAMHFAVNAGVTGSVSIAWTGQASAGASASAAVDVDGDGVPDWTGTAGTSNQTTLPVTAGSNGVVIAITTAGSAVVTGPGEAGYDSALSVLFRPTGGGGTVTVTWTANGPQCLGSLTGTDSLANRMLTLTLAVAGAPPNGFGIMAVGGTAATPVNLPFGTCQLLVDPNSAGGGLRSFLTDASGAATLDFRVRAAPFTTNFQAITFGFVGTNGVLGSTNALNMTAQ
jgi:hypothetical protein